MNMKEKLKLEVQRQEINKAIIRKLSEVSQLEWTKQYLELKAEGISDVAARKLTERELSKRKAAPDSRALADLMGAVVHERRMEKRRAEKGWHSPAECPCRQVSAVNPDFEKCPNCHPCMVPYDQLPESEKELDRAYPAAFMAILEKQGFKIVRE